MTDSHDLSNIDSRISLKGYFERVLREHQEALRVAEQEREKAAAALRTTLEAQMQAGDARLQDHITHQIQQVNQGLASLTAILTERDGRMDDRFRAHREAIQKAESSLNTRLEGMNEFRNQIRDQTSTFQTRENSKSEQERLMALIERNREDIVQLRADIVGKEAFDSTTRELTTWRQSIDKWRNEHAGRGEGISSTTKVMMSVLGAVVLLLGIFSSATAYSNRSKIDRLPQMTPTVTVTVPAVPK